MGTALDKPQPRGVFYERNEPQLMLSLANPPAGSRKHPERLDYLRAKPGKDGRWNAAAQAFNAHFDVQLEKQGDEWCANSGPKAIAVRFPSNSVADILDVRYLAFAAGRLAAKGDTNYAAVPEWQHHAPEWITAYPLEGEAERFQISGPDDPKCLGGQYDIPVDKDGRATLKLTATLSFTMLDVGSLLAVTQIQTSSVQARTRLWKALNRLAALGPLSQWLCLLRVVPYTYRYRDTAGKSHSTRGHTLDIYGPIRGIEDRTAITVAEAFQQLERAQQLGISGGQPAQQLPPAAPLAAPALEPGTWQEPEAEAVEGEVVEGPAPHNPDDDIPF